MDVICRPYPLTMAGCKVENYGFNFTNRNFTMTFTKNDFPKGISEVYIPEDRHYPDGFTVIYNDEIMLSRDEQSPTGLKLLKTVDGFDEKSFRYDDDSQHLIISDWSLNSINNIIKVIPGVNYISGGF